MLCFDCHELADHVASSQGGMSIVDVLDVIGALRHNHGDVHKLQAPHNILRATQWHAVFIVKLGACAVGHCVARSVQCGANALSHTGNQF